MSVTKLIGCSSCGVQLSQPATGRRRNTCSSACRQRAYRQRMAKAGLRPALSGNGSAIRLTGELREALKQEIDRRRRELLTTQVDADELTALRALFAEDGPEA